MAAGAGVKRAALLFAALAFVNAQLRDNAANSLNSSVKILNNATNCVAPSSDEGDFPPDPFTQEQRLHGAILMHFSVAFYCFIIIAFVCNDYFLPSVDCICQDLNLSRDVAGATFMAFATSAPELFVNVIGTFLTESDLGVGTVVGSAMCNTIGVPACAGLAAATAIPLEVWPLSRECSIYMSVIVLLTVILWDGKVYWYEALTLLLLYIFYCLLLFCQGRLHTAAKNIMKYKDSFKCSASKESAESATNEKELGSGTYKPYHFQRERINSLVGADTPGAEPEKTKAVEADVVRPIPEDSGVFRVPETVGRRMWWVFSWPVAFSLWATVPDCRTMRQWYPLTFLMCIIWIGGTSYVVSWMMSTVGQTFQVSDSVMGLTFLALGGSMPEATSGVINARIGIGSMSISNALGGNTLDILLSLGLPWFIKTLLPARMNGGPILIESTGLVYNNLAQLVCVAALFITAALNGFKLNRLLGVICLVLYILFIIFIIAVEVNMENNHQPVCS